MVYESASTLPFFGLLGRKGRKMVWLSHGFPHGEWDPLAMCSVRPNPKNPAGKNLAISGPLARPGRGPLFSGLEAATGATCSMML